MIAMLALSISLSREYTGPAQVGRQVWSVRYYVEILGLWDPQNRDPRRKSQKSERDSGQDTRTDETSNSPVPQT